MKKNFLNPASQEIDRRLMISSDDDLEDDSMVGILNAGAGSSGFSEEDEEEDSTLDEEEGLTGDDEEEDESSLNEEEQDYKKRFSDTKKDRDSIKAERDVLLEELDELKRVKGSDEFDQEDSEIKRRYASELISAIDGISADDPDSRKKVYEAIASQQANVRRDILKEVRNQQQQASIKSTRQKQERENALKNADIALQEVFEDSGLDYKKEDHLPRFQGIVDDLVANKPGWFEAIPASEQYLRIAKKVASKVENHKNKNREHLKSAGGYLKGGSKIKKRSSASKDDSDKPDSLVEALNLHQKNLHRMGAVRSKMVGRG